MQTESTDWRGYLLAFGAAASYGTAAPLLKLGLQQYNSVLTGITIALATGLLTVLPLGFFSWRGQGGQWRPERRALLFVLASGCTSLFGFSANTYALTQLPVVVVTPISSAYPLITVALVRLFFRHSEHLSWRIVVGACLIISGIICVTLSRH
jgi:drug/metabolite transporter (DMT)-like permease